MAGFFSRFGKGILYVLVCPIYILALALYAVYALIGFLIIFFKSIFLFFTGRSLHDDLPEDLKAKEILESLENKEANQPNQTINNEVKFEEEPEVIYPKSEPIDVESTPDIEVEERNDV